MLIHADPTKAIKSPYQMITINYFPTSVQRLYKIGDGIWLNYQEKAIKVNQGDIIYAKEIDQYGNETRIISSYTSNVYNALKSEAYDGNINTYTVAYNSLMYVDSSMYDKNITLKVSGRSKTSIYVRFIDENNRELSSPGLYITNDYQIYDMTATIPQNAKYMLLTGYNVYEIQ